MQKITVLIAEALTKAGFFDVAQNYLITYLSSLESASNEELEIAKPITLLAAANYITSPAVSQKSNLPSLKAVCIVPIAICVLFLVVTLIFQHVVPIFGEGSFIWFGQPAG